MEDNIYSSYHPDYTQKAIFYRNAKKEYVEASDGAELFTYYTEKGKHQSDFNILFVPGWSTGTYSWNDTWDLLMEHFNLYVLETREKRKSKLKRKHKGTINRHARDLKETMNHYNLNPETTFAMGPCFGAAVIAKAVAERYIQPKGVAFCSPTIKFPIPRVLTPLVIFPADFVYNIIAKPLLKFWMVLNYPKGIQRKTYFELLDNGRGSYWKKSLSLLNYSTLQDYSRVNVKAWVYGTKKDRLHKEGDAVRISESIPNSTYVEVPSYYYMHHNPGAVHFVEQIIENIESLTPKLELTVRN